ncbi:copper homeostasis protein CutC [Trichococcus alkaliphilus]|uniref:copper homeostasis protein CutC n=1 Tax=Trichococcus alkaliphilus TaxID=2052943 RepID=UPI000D0B2D18|nr:copper homeostasis protein CutC [Trichococcus alkaliphilus]
MLKEACVENFTNIPGVIERGAKRIELCDNLAVGGTTPSIGVIKIATEYCSDKDVSIIVILRPRGGDFVYSIMEKAIMMRDLEEIIALHANGIAVGALTAANELDKPFLEEIAKLPCDNGTELAFHMAFDQIPEDKQRDALLWLEKIGFTRILTHGGPAENTIFDNAAHIAKLAKISPDMTIMPGGGITKENLADLEKVLEFTEVHGTRIV